MLLVKANIAYSGVPFSLSGNKLGADFDTAFELLGSEMLTLWLKVLI